MAITEKMLRFERAMWFQLIGVDKHGTPQFADPLEVNVRWDDKSVAFTTTTGESVMSMAVVYISRDVSVGDALIRVAAEDITDTQRQFPLESGAVQIKQFQKIGNIRQRRFLRTCYL